MVSSSRENITSVASMAIENQTVGETEIKTTTETSIRLQESPASTGNATPVEKEATGLLIVGRRKEKRKTMILTTSSWEPHFVEKYKNITMNKISNNG